MILGFTGTRSPLAPVLVPRLLAVDLPRGYWSAGQRQLRHWDFDQPADSAPAEYFNVVWRTLLDLTFHDEMPEDVWPSGGDRWIAVMAGLLVVVHGRRLGQVTAALFAGRHLPDGRVYLIPVSLLLVVGVGGLLFLSFG